MYNNLQLYIYIWDEISNKFLVVHAYPRLPITKGMNNLYFENLYQNVNN